jgi:hypothetical protein
MTVDLSEDELLLITRALEHYQAYLVSQQRQDSRFLALVESLKRREQETLKPP